MAAKLFLKILIHARKWREFKHIQTFRPPCTVEPASLQPGSLHDPHHCNSWLTPIVYFCTIRNPHHCTTRIIAHFGWFPRSCNNAGSTVEGE